MCRHLAYVGKPVSLHQLLFEAPHALADQAERPRHQHSGDSNPDGWGVAWYSQGAVVPELYRTVTPVWDDSEFAKRSEDIECSAVLAAARLASPGATIDVTGNAPFVDGRWAFSLNGIVHGFADGVGDTLRGRIEPDRRARLVGDADTEVLFALVLQQLGSGEQPAEALAAVVRDVLSVTTGRLNLLLTDGEVVYATRVGNSLFQRGPVIASEPVDDEPGWREVPDHCVVVMTPDGSADRPL
jgi:gamma-glutamyl hercynylcysteine S-oxide hydrolase